MAINLRRTREWLALALTVLVVAVVVSAQGSAILVSLVDALKRFVFTYDTDCFTTYGRLILSGQDPFIRLEFPYPPTAFPLLSLWGIAPVFITALLVMAINFTLACLIISKDEVRLGKFRVWWLWLLFFPLTFTIQDGQVPVILLGITLLAYRFRKGWLSVFFAALVVMTKPQDGIILVLPLAVIWWREHKPSILQFTAVCGIWGAIPLVFHPGLYTEWFARMQERSAYYGPLNSPSFWNLGTIHPVLNVLAGSATLVTGIVILLLAFKRLNLPETTWINLLRILLVGILPFGMFYQNVYLVLAAPVGVMVPASLIGLILPGLFGLRNQLMVVIPLTALASWMVVNRRYFKLSRR